MDRTTEKRLNRIEGVVADLRRREDPANDPMLQLSPEDRELLLTDREARARGVQGQDTPELTAALQRYMRVLRAMMKAAGPSTRTPEESERIVAILRSGRKRSDPARVRNYDQLSANR